MISDRPTVAYAPTQRRKLIEVDLPLDDINVATEQEPTSTSGHPWRMFHWWARRRLAACRAVIFASMVDDPLSCRDEFPTPEAQTAERKRLHKIIKRLVVWENSGDEALLAEARYEIARSVARARGETAPHDPDGVLRYLRDNAPPIYDPFCGGGSIPLEAQRLGLRAVGSDLNPVAVLTTKALIQLPPRFNGQPPVNPEADPMGMTTGKGKRGKARLTWRGAAGLAADIRYYGHWMRDKAYKRIGHLYPTLQLPDGKDAAIVAWLWARNVPCPNPVCGIRMPLIKTFQLSKKRGYWVKPVVDGESKQVSFVVQDHRGISGNGTVNNNRVTCVACNGIVPLSYVREQGRAGNLSEQMIAIVAEGTRRRVFLSPTDDHMYLAKSANPNWRPSGKLPDRALGFRVQAYGFTEWHQLFTKRQLVALTTFGDQIYDVAQQILQDGANGDYTNAILTYLVLGIGKIADGNCGFVRWQNGGDSVAGLFSSQKISMVWDFAETNPFSNSTKNWISQVDLVAKAVENLPVATSDGEAHQSDASSSINQNNGPIVVTDPPYYDQVGYSDLSDFFYVWFRPLLREVYPELFAGILTPKQEELVASPRFEEPAQRFERVLAKTLNIMREQCSEEFPSSILYAYKQQERKREGQVSTGWETMLGAVVSAGFRIVGTWPIVMEKSNRTRSLESNALASSVVLVCRPRPNDAPVATRREFFDALDRELPAALHHLTRESHIAPTDLAQAAIGPGMKIYSQYSRVETIGGEPVPVREALAAINRAIAAYDRRQEGDLDSETRFCLDWLRQHGFTEGRYGEAETLAQAKNVAVGELGRLLEAGRGNVRLLPVSAYGDGRPPLGGMTAWEGCFRMAYHFFEREQGRTVNGAAQVARAMRGNVDSVERLARILYNHFDRKNDSPNAVAFNSLVTSWDSVIAAAQGERQAGLL